MSEGSLELDPLWNDLDWAIGQLFFMGWEGTEVTHQIKTLIEDYHLGAILLTAKNLKNAQETTKLVQELQSIARNAGHPVPLLIALDQENGGVNSLFDENFVCQFPSAMGVAATNSLNLAYDVAKATAEEISAVGVNMIMGPVLDVLTNARHQPLGVRATGDDPQEVSRYGITTINGYKDAGVATCGKHFPSYGNLEFLGSSVEMPFITETIEQLTLSALVPFRNAIREGLDSIMVGGCAMVNDTMNVMHACLSDQVVEDLLRLDLGFNGVTISECLEMDSLSHDIGVRGGTVMAVEAGCDLVLFCRSFTSQKEAISGLKLGIENGMISRERIIISLRRILNLKSKCTNWHKALNPPGIRLLSAFRPSHLELSTRAYESSITVVRDRDHYLPLLDHLLPEDELLLLTPLVKPLPASAASKALVDTSNFQLLNYCRQVPRSSIMVGEEVFRELGRSLARQRHGKLLHTSYTANGLRPVHENLIHRASAIIILTADANRNLYQNGFTKHVAMMCSMYSKGGKKKPLIVVAVSSPYDFAFDSSIGTYVCTFDFTETALSALVRALLGAFKPLGTLPGTFRKSRKISKSKQNWLVEDWDMERDHNGLMVLINSIEKTLPMSHQSILSGTTASSFSIPSVPIISESIEEFHYVVRNSSTQALFGFCSTYYYPEAKLGSISTLLVDPAKRNLSVGYSLHQRALRGLLSKEGIKILQLGSLLPNIYLGVPMTDLTEGEKVKSWFLANGWDNSTAKLLYVLKLPKLCQWNPREDSTKNIQRISFAFDLIYGHENASGALEYIFKHAGPETLILYHLALQDGNGIVRAKSPVDGSIVGTVIMTRLKSKLSTFIPALNISQDELESPDEVDNCNGGILAPVIVNSPQATIILQGLVHLGIRQSKAQGHNSCIMSWVQDDQRDILIEMGFNVVNAFEQLNCEANKIEAGH
ncbi:Beta-hexosaminidase [Erysiphe necator]|nr:Beta-hexosaminidase [Erysiphe necator]